MTINRKNVFIGITALLICFAVIFFNRQQTTGGEIFIYSVPFKTEQGWGYKIYRGNTNEKDTAKDKVYIKQDFMPGIPGKQGFATAADAEMVGNLVVKRISSNLMPMITHRDLDSLGLIRK